MRIYTTADCSGSPAAIGSAAAFSSPGLTVSAATGSTTFTATATDAAGNTSLCSTGFVYQRLRRESGGDAATPTAAPARLRQAVADACPASLITFDMDTVVTPIDLTSGEIALTKNATIRGPGAGQLRIHQTGGSRLFSVAPGVTAAIEKLTVDEGWGADGNGRGGNIYNHNGTLTVSEADDHARCRPGRRRHRHLCRRRRDGDDDDPRQRDRLQRRRPWRRALPLVRARDRPPC